MGRFRHNSGRNDSDEWLNRRSVLRKFGTLGVTGTAVAGSTGVGSAHHVEDIDLEPEEATMVVGEPNSFTVHWVSGHGSDACFIFAVRVDDEWIEIGQDEQAALNVGEHVHLDSAVTIPEEIEPGEYTLRVSASEAYHRCPHPGEKNYPILAADATITVESAAKARPNETDLATVELSNDSSTLQIGERGAKQWTVDGTESLFHEFFAISTRSHDTLPSYADAVTVENGFDTGLSNGDYSAELEFSWDSPNATLRVTRTVSLVDDENRFEIDYEIENRSSDVEDVKLHQYSDFDIGSPDNDVGKFHPGRSKGLLTCNDNGDGKDTVVGSVGQRSDELSEPHRHLLGPYQSEYDIEGDQLTDIERYPENGSGDPVGVQTWNLGSMVGLLPAVDRLPATTQEVSQSCSEPLTPSEESRNC